MITAAVPALSSRVQQRVLAERREQRLDDRRPSSGCRGRRSRARGRGPGRGRPARPARGPSRTRKTRHGVGEHAQVVEGVASARGPGSPPRAGRLARPAPSWQMRSLQCQPMLTGRRARGRARARPRTTGRPGPPAGRREARSWAHLGKSRSRRRPPRRRSPRPATGCGSGRDGRRRGRAAAASPASGPWRTHAGRAVTPSGGGPGEDLDPTPAGAEGAVERRAPWPRPPCRRSARRNRGRGGVRARQAAISPAVKTSRSNPSASRCNSRSTREISRTSTPSPCSMAGTSRPESVCAEEPTTG